MGVRFILFIVVLEVVESVDVAHIRQTLAADFNAINIQISMIVCIH